jgi:hypothetical protein
VADVVVGDAFTEPAPAAGRGQGDGGRGRGQGAGRRGAGPTEKPDPALLASLAGRYHSDELDATHEILLRDGALFLKRRAETAEEPLTPRGGDQLAARGMTLTVARDPSGRVTGYTVDAGRVTNIRFVRR